MAIDFCFMANYVKRCCGPDESIWKSIFGGLSAANFSVGGSEIKRGIFKSQKNHVEALDTKCLCPTHGRNTHSLRNNITFFHCI